jgi:predicted CXXCH cytochrome family protein
MQVSPAGATGAIWYHRGDLQPTPAARAFGATLSVRRATLLLSLAGAGLLAAAALAWWLRGASHDAPAVAAAGAHYVGSQTCTECHAVQHAAWLGSQHQLAMQHATPTSVLGDFDDARFTYAGVTSTFFRRDGKYFVRADGADGKLADFEVKNTFGLAPLQQYLIEFPDGRVQALSIAWDARPRAQGGQRWYHLYPTERIDHTDPLHWTRASQNWNFMCAECHSTDVHKNYDAAADTFKTTWSEISVGCEACHGAGSAHLQWARDRSGASDKGLPDKGLMVQFDERAGAHWVIDAATGNATRTPPRTSAKEIETCALCHARRGQIWEGHVPGRTLADTHVPALLTADLYEADGQMRDEVYNYGSFLQSRMFQQGVTCSDCHDPHSGKLRAPGNGVCLQCHSAEKYGTQAHTGHPLTGELASCPACHMPVRTYMGVDPRHDHSFRVPRPDLSVAYGTPNACNDCHTNKTAQWAADAIERWHGPQRKGLQAWTPAFHAARAGSPESKNLLLAVAGDRSQPAIGRATAYAELAGYLSPSLVSEVAKGLHDPSELVRLGALHALAGVRADQRWGLANHLLADPVRSVRIEAVSFLLPVPAQSLTPDQRAALERGIEEYIAVQRVNADRAESHLNLGLLYSQRGPADQAEAEYRKALQLEPGFVRAQVNLADLYRNTNRDADGEKLLREALRTAPSEAVLHHTLGLLLARQQRYDDALVELGTAARLAPEDARYAYVYAVALDSSGKRREALKVLEANHARHPADTDTLLALATINRDLGSREAALRYGAKLLRLLPAEQGVQQLMRQLQGGG